MRERSRNERKAHFLETINAFGSILMRTSSTQESAWCVAKHAVGELGYIDCIIYLINDDGELYQCAAHGNKNPTAQDVLNPIKLKMGEGICGHVALTGVSEIIANTSKDPRYIVDDEDRHSEITVPILSDGLVIGIIDSEHPEKDYFSNHDLDILNTIASMLSFKISQSKAIEELAIINKELAIQNEEKQKRADELAIANTELTFQNEEKQKRADELAIANTELTFQNEEKQKREKELTLANREKEKQANVLTIAVKELAFQNELEKTRIETESIAKELRQFIETANAPIFGIDNKGLVNEWNQTSEKITGFKKEDVLGQNLVKNYITKNYQVAVKKVLDNALKGEETANYEFPLFTKSGKRIMVLLNSSTRRNVEGKIIGVLGVGQDISEMDKLRTQSESVAKELRQFIETANAPIFGIDNKGRVNEWNQTSVKITGFTKDEVLGKNLVETYITQDYQKQVKEVLDNALKGQETANYEFPLFTKKGQRIMVLLNASTRRDTEGKITGVLGVGQDITILNEYKENLESKVEFRTQELQESLEREKELGQLKTSFVSMASHEFRTPLTSIRATSDVILRYFDKLSKEDINKRLIKIKNEVSDMTTILEDILIIGKSDAQKLDYNPELLDIISLIKDIITEYQLSEFKDRDIIYDIPLPKIMIQVDKKWIKHMVLNLLSNALKYSKDDTRVEISIKKEQDSVSFCFRDRGIGISKEDIKLLLSPFHRGNNVGEISGTGLGLSVLQKAVELHKGKIEIESEINIGSNFKVILPVF
ncbi:PAS domain S-box protein [Maribacter antarcticus]|uniref:PAS domain S-box protein n=1 Tax=Maribacter antarcticus TaxID=505250 RepID=UPI000684AFDD|nr:PAS domain S-box protein [Maribacter antarcticus]